MADINVERDDTDYKDSSPENRCIFNGCTAEAVCDHVDGGDFCLGTHIWCAEHKGGVE